jgi:protein arginine kinase
MDDNLQSIVVSTRIRFARNLAGYPFPHKLNKQQAREIAELMKIPLEEADDFQFSYTKDMPSSERELLKENYLISQKLIDNREISALFINPDETMCVMVNEEDHVREQYCATGYCLWKAYEYVSGIDDLIGDCLQFSYDQKLGFLTACPTNLGTGMRASVMLFLPGITKCNMLSELSARIRAMGLTIRGVYGEGSQAEGYMYQVSNEVTLGFDEKRILKEVQDAVVKIAEVEVRARKELYSTDPVGVEDECCRAYGILTNCRKISYSEFLQLIAALKTGVFMGLYKMTNIAELDELIISMRESNIRRYFAGDLTPQAVDEQRAQKVRQKIRSLLSDNEG